MPTLLLILALVMGLLQDHPVIAGEYRNAALPVAVAADPAEAAATMRGCIAAAADAHRLPPLALVILLNVEGGRPGRVSGNTNATVDIGPMQINQIWLPKLARRWNASVPDTFEAVRDSFCANVEGGAWILREAVDSAGGDFWEGMGRYHSSTDRHKTRYLRKVLAQALRLQDLAVSKPARPMLVAGR